MADVEAIVAFLTACHDEDERIAKAASPGEWNAYDDDPEYGRLFHMGDYGWTVLGPSGSMEAEDSEIGKADVAHIARHDPTDVLLRVDAERAIVTAYREKMLEYDELLAGTQTYSIDEDARDVIEAQAWGQVEGLEVAVQALAFGYRGRDEFDPSWFDHPWGPL